MLTGACGNGGGSKPESFSAKKQLDHGVGGGKKKNRFYKPVVLKRFTWAGGDYRGIK